MTTHLEILQDGWVQSSVDICNSIILKQVYTVEDWTEFFQAYYDGHLFTDDLWNYLNYPMFWWFDTETSYKLQYAHQVAYMQLLNALITRADLADLLLREADQREHFFGMLRAMHVLVNLEKTVLTLDEKLAILDAEEAWILGYPDLFQRGQYIDPSLHPYMALTGLQLHMTQQAAIGLTGIQPTELSDLFGLTGHWRQIFLEHGVYIADNERMSDADLGYLEAFFQKVPKTVLPINGLSNIDYYYASGQPRVSLHAAGLHTVNTFSTVGGYRENQFPSDIDPVYVDGFAVVVAHETTHIIDADYLPLHPELKERKDQLLQQAGDIDLEYLRSMIGSEYFQTNPQEFLASIGNEWYTDSEHTLQLGLSRFDDGYHEPINQFLLFCEIFSLGTNTTRFYTIDTEANVNVEEIPAERDAYNHINRLTISDLTYSFERDPEGNVIGWSVSPTPSECMISGLDAGTQTACDPVTNTYEQEVIVTYDHAPETGSLIVNGQSFSIEASPQSVILEDLMADGNEVDVTATFTDAEGCTATEASLFRAPADCALPPGPTVVSFVLIDPFTNQAIQPLDDHTVLDAGTLPKRLNIVAVTSPDTVGSVVLHLSGPRRVTRTENQPPYALFGENKGKFRGRPLPEGNYTLTAAPYTEEKASGMPGTSLTITFSIVDENEFPAMQAMEEGEPISSDQGMTVQLFPNPTQAHLHIRFKLAKDFSDLKLQVSDLNGKILLQKEWVGKDGWQEETMEVDRFTSGLYLLHLITNEEHIIRKFTIAR